MKKRKQIIEEKKTNHIPKIKDEELDKVTGGVVIPPPKVEDDAYMVTATAECKNCHHTFNYKYHYEEGGIPNGPWNHPVPDYCPDCDPNVPHDR